MSPHGSKVWELIRYLANLLLTDSQRKKIKTFFARLQQIPLRILGIDSLVNAQRGEIERLKSRLTIMDGKFNIALYGMPRIDEKYRAVSISNSFLSQYDPPAQLGTLESPWPSYLNAPEFLKKIQIFPQATLLKDFVPQSFLSIGLDSISLNDTWKSAFPSLQRVYYSDADSQKVQVFRDYFADKKTGKAPEFLDTDPITSLIALNQVELDSILCVYRLQRLAPLEQVYFLHLAVERLRDGGVLVLVLPDTSDAEVVQDTYWADPRNLRIFSLGLLKSVFTMLKGRVEIQTGKSQSGLEKSTVVIFRKSAK